MTQIVFTGNFPNFILIRHHATENKLLTLHLPILAENSAGHTSRCFSRPLQHARVLPQNWITRPFFTFYFCIRDVAFAMLGTRRR